MEPPRWWGAAWLLARMGAGDPGQRRALRMPGKRGALPAWLVGIAVLAEIAGLAGLAGCVSSSPPPAAVSAVEEPVAAAAGALSATPVTPATPGSTPAPDEGAARRLEASQGQASSCPAWLAQQRRGEGRLYAMDRSTSTVRILVFRGGRLATLGHHHVIGAEQHLVGQVYLPRDGLAEAGAELAFRLDQLVLDAPAWRAAMGGEFAKALSEADIAGTRANMLKALEADRFPVVQASTVAVEAAWPRPVLRLKVSLHGQERLMDLPLEAARPEGDGPLRARGRLVIRQTDFGIKPFTVLGGLLAIQDALVVELDLVAQPATACQALPR